MQEKEFFNKLLEGWLGRHGRPVAYYTDRDLFVPFWERRFAVAPRSPPNAHRPLGREHRLEQILSVRVARTMANDYTVSRDGERRGVAREQVRAGMRGARVEVERRLDGGHWLRFRGGHLPLVACRAATPMSVSPSGLRPAGLTDQSKPKPQPQYIPHPSIVGGGHFYLAENRTFLLCVDTRPRGAPLDVAAGFSQPSPAASQCSPLL